MHKFKLKFIIVIIKNDPVKFTEQRSLKPLDTMLGARDTLRYRVASVHTELSIQIQNKGRGVLLSVEHLPSKHEVQFFNMLWSRFLKLGESYENELFCGTSTCGPSCLLDWCCTT